jgi:hypothetical protein
MWSLLAKADATTWLPVLVQSNKDAKRRGQFSTGELGRQWTAVDGKYQVLDHHADGMAQKFQDDEKGTVYRRLGVLRAVQVAAPGRPALGQWPIRPVNNGETDPDKIKFTGEITNLWPFVMWLRGQYGELTENFTVDAGPWSRELFARFNAEGFGLFGNLKENKPELFTEAERVLRIAMARREERHDGDDVAQATAGAGAAALGD